MGIETNPIVQQAKNQIFSVGKAGMSALFPNDFEVYMMAIELVDSNDKTIDYFVFPVMPSSIFKKEIKRTNVKITSNGITALTSPTFMPEEIQIKGNFGKYFKILLNTPGLAYSASEWKNNYSVSAGKYSLSQINNDSKNGISLMNPVFDLNVKTGYGCIKILRAIISKSNGLDKNGKPFKLYFYNMALGESYLVIVPANNGFSISQNQQNNMIWEYNLNLTILAPLDKTISESRSNNSALVKTIATSQIQQSVNDMIKTIAKVIV